MISKYFILTLRGLGALGILFLCFILFMSLKRTLKPTVVNLVSEEERRGGACPGPTETPVMKETLMPKHFPAGSKFNVLPNWYSCHPVERGDTIYLRYSFKLDSVVRIVYGVPGDKFQVIKDSANKAWGVSINGERVQDADGKSHFFGNENAPLLSLYTAKDNKGTLGPKNFIVFSESSPSNADSGTLGLVSVDDFLGKVQKP
jgi:hypothetical protein